MLLWQSSGAPPAGILACLPVCIQGQVIGGGPVLGPNVLGPNGESPFAPNRPRACVSHVGEHDEGPLLKTRA